jgi:hypothetical protein
MMVVVPVPAQVSVGAVILVVALLFTPKFEIHMLPIFWVTVLYEEL